MAKIEIPVLSKEEMEAYIDRKFAEQLAEIKKLVLATPPPVVEPPKPQLPDCQRGPTIKSMTQLSARMYSVLWDGLEVTRIKISAFDPTGKDILKDVQSSKSRASLVVNEGEENVFAPDANTLIIALKETPVAGKEYRLVFKATNCTGESAFFFEQIETPAPPPTPEKPCIPLGRITKIELTQL